ncbi:hypothetical protein, partial [Burkholderia vietnamiensis]|uniref:hypothetical protein n=2 Tax=Burkholderia vietnamiensis TaxID=60552 RepID=UPI001E32BADB
MRSSRARKAAQFSTAIVNNRHTNGQQIDADDLRWLDFRRPQMQKPPPVQAGVLGLGSLTITYFHTGIRTIIGVESFHG